MLKFSKANSKIHALKRVAELQKYLFGGGKIYSFDLLSGFSCPFAVDCLSKSVMRPDGTTFIKDGPFTKFRCFSASQENQYPNTRKSRASNFEAMKGLDSGEIAAKLIPALPHDLGILRIHVGGDFFNPQYMLGWATVAEMNPNKLFYAYTKSLPYWLKHRKYINTLDNFVLTASYGGRHDNLIGKHRLRYSKVVHFETEQEKIDAGFEGNKEIFTAEQFGLEIDHDDSHAANPTHRGFALLLHGTQPAKTDAAKVLVKLKGKGSYSSKKKVA